MSEADGAQYRLGVLDADRARYRNTEETERLLPVDHRDNARLALLLQPVQQIVACGRKPERTAHLLKYRKP
jgi:hypothetical protein